MVTAKAQHLPPYAHHHVPTGAGSLHVAELPASGPALVFIHGIGMDWRVWQALSRRLHPHFRLLMFDLRGHGESGKPEQGYSLAHYAADVEDVIDAFGLVDATLIGSSLGGMVASVVEAPADIVSRRILVDPPLTGGPIRDISMFRDILRLKHGPPGDLAAYLGRSYQGTGRFILTTMATMWQAASDGVITEMLAQPNRFFAVESALSAIETPVLLMQADPTEGGVLSDAQAEEALARMRHGTLIRFQGVGHAIHGEAPARFVAELYRFLTASAVVNADSIAPAHGNQPVE